MKMRTAMFFTALALMVAPWMWSELRSQQPTGLMAPSSIVAESTSSAAAAGNLVSMVQTMPGGRTQLIVLDVSSRCLATYFILPENGGIELKSVRNIDADLKLKDFNGLKPTPDEVRAVVQP